VHCCLLTLCVILLLSTHWFRLNISASVPYGLYRLEAVSASPPVGTLALLPAPQVVWPWWSRWLPMLKPVAAVGGAMVCASEHVLFVDGLAYGPIYQEAHGQALPQFLDASTCRAVPEGEVFLASAVERSLDSRYFGPVRLAELTALAVPVVTWSR
jgi:type IV secretory pathway protease TraF